MRRYAKAAAAAALATACIGGQSAIAAEPEKIVLAGGCFWCMEEAYEKIPGVLSVVSGYTGGGADDASYRKVLTGRTGHYEAVEIEYDPTAISYAELIDAFWMNIDPFDSKGQFCDKGTQYLSAIFFEDEEQKALAESTKAEVESRFGQSVATEILPAEAFYHAEEKHQDFYKTNAAHYKFYKFGCGRPQRLEELWGKPEA